MGARSKTEMIFEMSSTIEGRPQHTAGESDKQHFMRIEKHEAPLHCIEKLDKGLSLIKILLSFLVSFFYTTFCY